jgi:L-alanine-DL-glutamate epimerase-like enolase superfamily enzyme
MSGEPLAELAWCSVAVPLATPVRAGALVIGSREYCFVRARLAGGALGEAFVLTRGLDVAGAVRDLVAPRLLADPPHPAGRDTGGGDTDGSDTDGSDTDGSDTDGSDTDGSDTDGSDTDGSDTDGSDSNGAGAADPLRVSLRNIGWDGPISRAAAAVTLAVLDARARAGGLPVSRLLGAPAVPAPRAVVAIGYPPLHPGPAQVAAAEVEEALRATARGVTCVKLMAAGGPPEAELARIRRLREVVGPGCEVALDVNGGWPLRTALDMLPRLLEAGAAFIEEPWPYELGLAGFAALGDLPRPELAFGEVSSSVIELEALAGTGAVRYLRADATLLGGPAPFARVLPAAAANGCVLLPHLWPDVHRHLVAAYPGPALVECVLGATGGFGLDRFVEGTAEVRDGVVVGPDRPGFGYRLDWAAIRELAGAPAFLARAGRP